MLRQFAHKLKEIFVNNKSDHTRELFFDLMVYLYDKFDEFKVRHTQDLIDIGVHFDLFLQPLTDIHLFSDLEREEGNSGGRKGGRAGGEGGKWKG